MTLFTPGETSRQKRDDLVVGLVGTGQGDRSAFGRAAQLAHRVQVALVDEAEASARATSRSLRPAPAK
jgi:hypothetical protein